MSIIQYLSDNPLIFFIIVFFFSLAVGSFLNVVIYRLPIMLKREWKSDCLGFLAEELEDKELQQKYSSAEDKTSFNLSIPRSRCPSCGHQISALENIPVISWLFLRGKCSQCGAAISIRYLLIELTTALLSVLVAYTFGVQWFTLAAIVLTWVLIALTVIDFDTQLLPDNITLPFLWLGILLSLTGISPISLTDSVIGAIAGYLVLWTVYQVFKLVTGKEGMGFGDFKLLALLGAWLGWQALPMILLLAALVGSIVGSSLIRLLGRDKNIPIPFGPYLAAAGFIALLWGDQIKQAYFTYMGL